ncbi:hypothetical protein ACP6PL_10560 [Dapis sp. BLCC M126]
MAKLSEDYYTCPDGDGLKIAENLAREKSQVFGLKNERSLSSFVNI